MRLPYKTLERKLFQSGYKNIIAVDEVGMGALAGPVVVCAVSFTKKFYEHSHKKLHWLRDSKLLSSSQRESFANIMIHDSGFKFQVSYCYPKTIDRLNIYQAARLAMRRAIQKLSKVESRRSKARKVLNQAGVSRSSLDPKRIMVLVDGKNEIKDLKMDQTAIVKGDRKVFAIACASILAKVYRDRMMIRYAKKFPEYAFEKHKGYGTKLHIAQLIHCGPSEIHRYSFSPVTKIV